MDTHVKVLAILHIVFSALSIVAALIILLATGMVTSLVGSAADPSDAQLAIPFIRIGGGAAAAFFLALGLPGLCAGLGEVARRHPTLRLIIDHLALPIGLTGPDALAGLPEVLALSRFPNVAVKASALPCHSARPYPFADLHHAIHQVYDAFGPLRMFWGSDWTRLPCAYGENLALFTHELPFLTEADKAAILGEALLAWLDWR